VGNRHTKLSVWIRTQCLCRQHSLEALDFDYVRITEEVGRKDWGREDREWGQGERARRVEIGKGWCGVCRRKRKGQKKTKGKNRRLSQSEKSFRKCWEWEEENIVGIEE
jgi:hypothetical protein